MRNTIICLGMLAAASTAFAQNGPSITSVVSAASYLNPLLRNSNPAAGSMIVIFGSNLGPGTLVQASSFPIPTALGGTSVNIIGAPAGATQAYIIYSSANQVAAILPSNLALQAANGTATYTLSLLYNGVRSNPYSIVTTISNFDIFTVNQAGYGQAVAQNYNSDSDQPQNSYTNPAMPNQTVILWGTGVGPYKTPDDQLPQPSNDAAIPLTLYVGGVQASVAYHGRSGCCAGIDQVVFSVPQGVVGCTVPVTAVIQVPIPGTSITTSYVGNTATIAVSPDGSTCSDPLNNPSSSFVSDAASGKIRVGSVTLTHMTGSTDTGAASFASAPYAAWANSIGYPNPGACTVFTVQNNSAPIVNLTGLNAGPAINITGNGTKYPLTAQSTGQYSGSTGTFSPGVYTVDNGAGGTDVGPFSASINVGSPLTWSLSGSPAAIPAGQSQTVTWSGGDPNGFVVVLGASLISVEGLGILTTFECTQNNSAGQFTIPGYITYNMSANAGTQGEIAVVGTSAATPLSAPGLDTGVVTYMSGPPGKNIGFTAGTGLKN